VERSWSDAAETAFASYPWRSDAEAARARQEAELVAFGAVVEVEDLPLAVRRHMRKKGEEAPRFVWRGEAWRDLRADFEKAVFSQALEKAKGNCAAAARSLKTTPRVVTYAARKYNLVPAT
jgi:transcriptional regulator with GAF, ATPase, and Fis domain